MNFDKEVIRWNTNATKYKNAEKIIPMCVADMDFLSSEELRNDLVQKLTKSIYGYSYISLDFYNSIIEWIKVEYNWNIKKENILYSQSVLSSITSAIQSLTDINDDILLLTPEYHAFFYLITRNNRNVIECPLKEYERNYSIDFSILESLLTKKTKVLLFSSPHNPIGKVWTYEELKELGNFCLKNNLIILSDEIHADLTFQRLKHIPIASISNDISNITLTFNSPSKSFNLVGLTLSYIVGTNKEYLSKIEKQLTINLYNKVNVLNEFNLINAYKQINWLNELKKYLNDNILISSNFFLHKKSKIKFNIPDATYLIWLDFREFNLSNDEIEKRLLENAKVRLLNGNDFCNKGEGFFRMNIALPRKKLKRALEQINNEFNKIKDENDKKN